MPFLYYQLNENKTYRLSESLPATPGDLVALNLPLTNLS